MSFLGLVPADQVGALYILPERVLRLEASGTVPIVTTGITFDRQALPGGLKFVLEGWSGPLIGETEPYVVSQEFPITLPNPAIPSGKVIVVTANHPNGIAVPINSSGIIIPQKPGGPTPETTSPHNQLHPRRRIPLLLLSRTPPSFSLRRCSSTNYSRRPSRSRRRPACPPGAVSRSNSTTPSSPCCRRASAARISSGSSPPSKRAPPRSSSPSTAASPSSSRSIPTLSVSLRPCAVKGSHCLWLNRAMPLLRHNNQAGAGFGEGMEKVGPFGGRDGSWGG
jgi:hypothetical protein